MDLLSNGKSALTAFQRALVTTSHNIANVNTEGYTRQEVSMKARVAQGPAASGVGSGVETGSVVRVYDEYLTARLRSSTSSSQQMDVYEQYANEVDQLFGNPETGVSSRLTSFFSSIQSLSDNPASIAARQGVIGEAELLGGRLNEMDAQLAAIEGGTRQEMTTAVSNINSYASGIADINRQITETSGGTGDFSNDLLDQRDLLVSRMSESIGVSTATQYDGSVNVYMGNGQSLVIGSQAERLSVSGGEFSSGDVAVSYLSDSGPIDVTNDLAGGRIGGLINFTKEVLDPARGELGRIAVALSAEFNSAHTAGLDLNGNAGMDFFTSGVPAVAEGANNTGTSAATVAITDTTQISASDYILSRESGSWVLTQLSNDSQQTLGAAGPFVVDGLTIDIAGAANDGDKHLIMPTRGLAADISVLVKDPMEVAAAGPTGGSGNNENALLLGELQMKKTLDNGNTSFDEAYAAIVSDVGTLTYQAGINADTQRVLLEHSQVARDGVSGVNLDEEAANLMKYQQAYQAAAKLISVSDSMFQSLLSAVGGR